ncbi:MAG: HAD family phosphatase [Clostridia bacterium]|nr:HAD family phosphatase [Clostridia bacterium]
MKKICIFDLDGTLIDSMPEWAQSMIKILNEEKIEYPENIIDIITPLGNLGAADLFIEMGVKCSKEELLPRMRGYAYEAYAERIPLKSGVENYLKKLREEGHILAVLTASPHITTDVCLKRCGVYDLFEKVWSVEDFGLVKADPQIYHKAAERLGADISEITFFDDNLIALTAAKEAGLMCVGVYDSSSDSNTEKIKSIADVYIDSFLQLV